jgi:hypothetical protein
VLLPGVAAIAFSYYGGSGWTHNWAGNQPPMLVRIRIAFIGGRLHWPDVIVAPMRRQDGQ